MLDRVCISEHGRFRLVFFERLVCEWVKSGGLDLSAHGTHTMRRIKVSQFYSKTGNLRLVQLLLGHPDKAIRPDFTKKCNV